MQQALLGEVPQVAADGVLGHAKAGHQLRGDDPAVALDPLEDRLSAFSRQHLRVIARTCRFLRLTPRPSHRRTSSPKRATRNQQPLESFSEGLALALSRGEASSREDLWRNR